MKQLISSAFRGLVALGWVGLGVTVAPLVVSQPGRPAQAESPAIARPTTGRPVSPQARPVSVERPEEVATPREFVPPASWDVFKPWARPDDRPPGNYRFFELPSPNDPLPPIQRGEPEFALDGETIQARYDNDESRYNIRETLNRLEKMGIKVMIDWNQTYGTESPLDLAGCLAENWELRFRQQQLNALADGAPLPAYQNRPARMSRVIPIGWTQCGSGVCKPGNPYCPYRSRYSSVPR